MPDDFFKGYVSVLDFGACPNSFEDDTAAFQEAVRDGRSIYVPSGIYYIREPLLLTNCNFIGAGSFATQILSICEDPSLPILYTERSCVISDMCIGYRSDLITGEETEGQRIGIITKGELWCLQRCSTIRNLRIVDCGTAIYSADSDGLLGGPFSVLFESLEIQDFSFRGIDFTSRNRSGNVFENIYMCSERPNVDAMINLRGEDSQLSIHQLNLEHTKCRTALRFIDVYTFSISTLHIQNIQVPEGGNIFELHNSAGHIDALDVYYLPIPAPDIHLFWIGDGLYDTHIPKMDRPNTVRKLWIGQLHVKGMNDPTFQQPDVHYSMDRYQELRFFFFYRPEEALGEYRVHVEDYIWFSYKNDQEFYETMPRDPYGRLTFTKLGELPLSGPTDQRPRTRLCPYCTGYFDTDLNRYVVYDGQDWN